MNDSFGLIAGIITFVVIVVLYVWVSLALAAVFRKAGEAGWQGWVPILNTTVLLRLGDFSPWMILIGLVPIFGWAALPVILIISYHRINRAFGHGAGMTVLAALLFPVWASVLGFGSSRWIGPAGGPPAEGPARGGYIPPRDDGAPPLLAAWDSSTPPSPPAAPAPAARPEPAAPSASTPAGFWAPPPLTPAAAAPAPSVPTAVVPSLAASPAQPPVPPPPGRQARGGLDDDLEDSAVDPEDRVAAPAAPAGSFLPPPPSSPRDTPARAAEPFTPIESVPVPAPSTDPASADKAPVPALAPVAEVPAASGPVPEPEPWAPAPMPLRTPAPTDPEGFPELSEAVSAVVGAPDAGAPRSARSSVSALYAQPEIPEDDDALDQTIVTRRRRVPWSLIPPGGAPVDITSEVVILGRRPAPDPAHPGAQLISISDETRTVSKTHARLELRGDTWFVTDLGSTNGVLFATLMGTEVEAQPGQELEAGERFFLGDAEVRLKKSDA